MGLEILEEIVEIRNERRLEGKCSSCCSLVDVLSFKNEISRKEFRLSGMCQSCQDEFFE